MVVEQKGRDVWRGRYRSIEEAIENDAAGIGVDRILLTKSKEFGVTTVLVVVEEQRKIFLAPVEKLLDTEHSYSRANYQGRGTRVMDIDKWVAKYLGPDLHPRKRIASA